MKDEDIGFSDMPKLDAIFLRRAGLIEPNLTESITLRVRCLMVAYFKVSGKVTRRVGNRVLKRDVWAQREPR